MSNKITSILLFLSIGVFLFGIGYKLGEYKSFNFPGSVNYPVLNGAPAGFDSGLFWQTWNDLQQKYVDKKKIDPKKMFYGALKGMVSSVDDPYTFFLTPDENKQTKEDLGGQFEGIGAQLGLKDNRIIIIAPLKNSPAEKAGVKAGDFITKVDGQSTQSWTLTQAVLKIRGKKGEKVVLTLDRNGKEITVPIVRDQINVSSVDLSYENNVAILKLNQFGDNTNAEWDKAVTDIKNKWDKKQIKGMVLDLRDNPGGFLDSAVYLASEFLPQGKLIVKQESTTTGNHDYYSERSGNLQNIPLSILINKGSASASEILAGALRDYNRAKLVGEKSFGKGSVQEALDLKNGAGLHVTVAKWVLPNGDWINGKGITPDISIENKVPEGNTLNRAEDAQLDKAIEVVLNKNK